ncbi:MAG: hypothetical protein IKD72_10815 [Clostridia bacterium]|nr:hypothetical protein [Clostridia bacterium]
MAFFPPIPLIRRNLIVQKLQACGAVSPETAKTLAEAGVVNPNGFRRITVRLVKTGVIKKAAEEKYYID